MCIYRYVDQILKICMSPLSDKCKKLTSLQQFQDDLTEVGNVVHAVMIVLCLYVQATYVC